MLAAAGLMALRGGSAGMIERLAEDHANARRLAEALGSMPGITGLDPSRVRTNFVIFRLRSTDEGGSADTDASRRTRGAFLGALARSGILMVEYPHLQVRAVTHYGIEPRHIEAAIDATRRALAEVGLAGTPALAGAAAPAGRA